MQPNAIAISYCMVCSARNMLFLLSGARVPPEGAEDSRQHRKY